MLINFTIHTGGPKLRKWYGAPDPMQEDGSELEELGASGLKLLPLVYNSGHDHINIHVFVVLISRQKKGKPEILY